MSLNRVLAIFVRQTNGDEVWKTPIQFEKADQANVLKQKKRLSYNKLFISFTLFVERDGRQYDAWAN